MKEKCDEGGIVMFMKEETLLALIDIQGKLTKIVDHHKHAGVAINIPT